MRRSLAIPGLIALLLAACHQQDTERVDEGLIVTAGTTIESEVRSDDRYPWHWFWGYDADVDHLPPGFFYDTEDVYFDGHDRLWVEFTLSVAAAVAPGVYGFEVTYEFYDGYWSTIDEVEFRFTVEVLEAAEGEEDVLLRLGRSVAEEEWQAGADTVIRIERK
jgi:hypothetical protein